jgi:exopolysaccharide biosynthesis WecB/TagA/CpsF family protein
MGVPRQELWIARNITPDHCTMPMAVGALLDFVSGAVPRAPKWMRQLRLEWVFRLIVEPSRLWQRYILGNPVFLARVIRQKFSSRIALEGKP